MNRELNHPPPPEDLNFRLAQLKAGDRDAIGILFKAIKNKLVHRAFETLTHPSEVDDVVQQVQIRMWERREMLPNTWREASLYIQEMAANLARDINRLARSQRNVELDKVSELAAESCDFTTLEELEILVERLRDRLLPALPPRRVRILAAVAERLSEPHRSMSDVYKDVGEKLGLSWGSIRNEWSHTVRALDDLFPNPLKDEDSRELLQLIGMASKA